MFVNFSLAMFDGSPTSIKFSPFFFQRNEHRGIQIQMGRGGLGSTGPCFERQVGSRTNQVPRPLLSLSQQRKDLDLTYCAAAPGLFGRFCGLGTSHAIFLLSHRTNTADSFECSVIQMNSTSIKFE